MQNEKCKSCFECSETVFVKIRDDRNAGWRDSSLRRCANDQCWHIVDGTRQDRLAWISNVYDYKYFGDYELSPEQLAAVYEAKSLAADAAALSDEQTQAGVEAAIPTANCCVCGRIIDTREKSEGGDDFGDETEPGKWTCSVQCFDAHVGFVPDVPAVEPEPVCTVALVGAAGFRWLSPHPVGALDHLPVGTPLYAAPVRSAIVPAQGEAEKAKPNWWHDEAAAEQEFAEYFCRNYPGPDTIIYDPKWHAPKIFRPKPDFPNLFGNVIAESIVKAVTEDPGKALSEIGFRWACAIALKQHWPDLDSRTAAYWLTDYIGVPVGTHGYDWTYGAAQDLAREYVGQFGETV